MLHYFLFIFYIFIDLILNNKLPYSFISSLKKHTVGSLGKDLKLDEFLKIVWNKHEIFAAVVGQVIMQIILCLTLWYLIILKVLAVRYLKIHAHIGVPNWSVYGSFN